MLLDLNATRQHCKEAESTKTARRGRQGGRALRGHPIFSGSSSFLQRPSRGPQGSAGSTGPPAGWQSITTTHSPHYRSPACLPTLSPKDILLLLDSANTHLHWVKNPSVKRSLHVKSFNFPNKQLHPVRLHWGTIWTRQTLYTAEAP